MRERFIVSFIQFEAGLRIVLRDGRSRPVLGIEAALEPRYWGPSHRKLVFRHSEANQISGALTVGLELCSDNDSEALRW